MRASGQGGELRVGYQQAAQLGPWVLETSASPALPALRFTIEAPVSSVDQFWVTQAPMTLDLRFGRFHWVWDEVRPELVNGHVSVRVFGKPLIVKE